MVYGKSSGNYARQEDLYDRVGWRLGEKTEAGDISETHEFTEQMGPRLERAVDHPNMTPELVEALSRQKTRLDYRIETEIVSSGDEG